MCFTLDCAISRFCCAFATSNCGETEREEFSQIEQMQFFDQPHWKGGRLWAPGQVVVRRR